MGRTFCTTHPSRPSLKHKSSPLKSKNICASFRLPGIFALPRSPRKGNTFVCPFRVARRYAETYADPPRLSSCRNLLPIRIARCYAETCCRSAFLRSITSRLSSDRKNRFGSFRFLRFALVSRRPNGTFLHDTLRSPIVKSDFARFNSENRTFNRKNRTFICEIGPFIRPVFSAAGSVRSPAPPRIPIPRR